MLTPTGSPELFHELVNNSLTLWRACVAERGVRSCAYNATLIPWEYTNPVRLHFSRLESESNNVSPGHLVWGVFSSATVCEHFAKLEFVFLVHKTSKRCGADYNNPTPGIDSLSYAYPTPPDCFRFFSQPPFNAFQMFLTKSNL